MMAIFTMLIPLVYELGSSFHLITYSVSFCRDLKFLSYRSLICLVRVMLRFFILFVAIVEGAFSLISFSTCLLFVLRRATDVFWVDFVSSHFVEDVYRCLYLCFCRCSLAEILGPLIYVISSANSNILTSFFPILSSWYPLVVLLL